MDPNAALEALREAYSKWEDIVGDATGPLVEVGGAMRDAAVALDEWKSSGGFDPRDWQRVCRVDHAHHGLCPGVPSA